VTIAPEPGYVDVTEATPTTVLNVVSPCARTLTTVRCPAAAPTIDLTVHFRAPAAAAAIVDEPLLAVFRSSTAAGGFFEEDGELWSADGVLLAHSRQLALAR